MDGYGIFTKKMPEVQKIQIKVQDALADLENVIKTITDAKNKNNFAIRYNELSTKYGTAIRDIGSDAKLVTELNGMYTDIQSLIKLASNLIKSESSNKINSHKSDYTLLNEAIQDYSNEVARLQQRTTSSNASIINDTIKRANTMANKAYTSSDYADRFRAIDDAIAILHSFNGRGRKTRF